MVSSAAPLHSIRLRIIVAASAVAVLVVGYALRPEAQLPPPALEEQPSPILREAVERREAASIYVALQQVARTVAPAAARLLPLAAPLERWSDIEPDLNARVRYGVAVAAATLVADAADLPVGSGVSARLGNGRTVMGLVTTHYPRAGLALVAVGDTEPLPVPAESAAAAAAGELVVAVAPGENGLLVLPVAVAEVRRGGLSLSSAFERYRGVPVFNAQSEWLGIIADGDDGMRVVRPGDLAAEEAESPAPPALGVSLRLEASEAGPRPVIVDEVAAGGRAAAAGLQAGDVIASINGEAPAGLEAAVAALRGDGVTPVSVAVRRGRRVLTVRLDAAAAQP